MLSRRNFLRRGAQVGIGIPLWLRLSSGHAVAQTSPSSQYRAIVCVGLSGGNDGNNMLIPSSGAEYQQYSALRGTLAYAQQDLVPLNHGAYNYPLALNPALPNVAALFNAGSAAFVANVGPLKAPATKDQLLAQPSLIPPSLLSHPAGIVQWQSATTVASPDTGWGGRIADLMVGQSGSLPMVLNGAGNNIFTCGSQVQGITIQGGSVPQIAPIPVPLQNAALTIAQMNTASSNQLIAHAAQVRAASVQQQLLLAQTQAAGSTLKTVFPTTAFGNRMATIASLINGRSVNGSARQIFYCDQGLYDTHQNQLANHAACLSELDLGLAAFMQALQEMGLSEQVLVCTQSDFNRTMQINGSGGTDHAWGNHQLILGGGIKGGQIIGTLPDLDLGGSQDLNGAGTWIPTLSVSQFAAGVGSWIGLSNTQLATAFPELSNFSQGAISLV